MNQKDFDAVVDDQVATIKRLLKSKGTEYARGDRLSNFKNAATMQRTDALRACLGIMTKQMVSIVDFALDFAEGRLHTRAEWDEKVGDAVNYLILMKAVAIDLGLKEDA